MPSKSPSVAQRSSTPRPVQCAVIPAGIEKEAKAVNFDLDEGIEQNLDAVLIENQTHANVKYDVKSGVVTLSGEVNSEDKRTRAGQKLPKCRPFIKW